jgi:hypothetical protein
MTEKRQPSAEDLRSLWRERHGKVWTFYCPQCRAARRADTHPDPARFENFARVGLSALVFMICTWNWFAWKGVFSFFPIWAVFEIVHRSRVRGMLACPHCGFDPYLYLVDVKLARSEIEAHWKRKFAEHGIPFPAPKHGGAPEVAKEPAAAQRNDLPETTQSPEEGSP